MTTVQITGKVLLTPGLLPAPGLQVEIWAESAPIGRIGVCSTNLAGAFSCILNEDATAQILAPNFVAIKYLVKKNGSLLAQDAIDPSSLSGEIIDITIELAKRIIDEIFLAFANEENSNTYINIRGRVIDKSNAPFPGLKVDICENKFRDKKILATVFTDNDGRYETQFDILLLGDTQNLKRSIKIDIYSGEDFLISSGDIFDRPKIIVRDFKIDDHQVISELDKFTNLISDAISPESLETIEDNIGDNNDPISFIAGATGLGVEALKSIINARKFAREFVGDSTDNLYAANSVFYAMIKGLGNSTNPLLIAKTEKIYELTERAIEQNIITADHPSIFPLWSDFMEWFVDAALDFRVAHTKATVVEGESYTINDLLVSIFCDRTDAQADVDAFLREFNKDFESIVVFWDNYASQQGEVLAKTTRDRLKLATITNFQPAIITKLISDFSFGHISGFARLTVDEWVDTVIFPVCEVSPSLLRVPASIRGQVTLWNDDVVHQKYARRLASVTQALFPLANINRYLDAIIEDAGIRAQVSTFIELNPTFDPRETSILDINAENPIYDLTDVTNLPALISGLEPIARLLKVVGGNPLAVITFLSQEQPVSSATEIAGLGWDAFSATYGYLFAPTQDPEQGGPCASQEVPGLVPDTKKVFRRALSISNGLATVLGGIYADFTNPYPAVLNGQPIVSSAELPVNASGIAYPHLAGSGLMAPHATDRIAATGAFAYNIAGRPSDAPSTPTTTLLTDDPGFTLRSMMGSLEYAACTDCESVYSPAAYLADTLNYLKTAASSVYDELDRRRPDIKSIDLNCENTNTIVLYIDLVNELLESKVIAQLHFTVPTAFNTVGIKFVTERGRKVQNALNTNEATGGNATNGSGIPSIRNDNAGAFSSSAANAVTIGNNNIVGNDFVAPGNSVQVTLNSPSGRGIQNLRAPAGDLYLADAPAISAIRDATAERADVEFNSYALTGSGPRTAYEAIYEHVNGLTGRVYPTGLPFNLAIEETRAYLVGAGTTRLELKKLFRPIDSVAGVAPDNSKITDYSIYCEYLGLTETQAKIIDGTHGGDVYWLYGNIDPAHVHSPGTFSYIDPQTNAVVSFTSSTTTTWVDHWKRIDVLLQETSISYSELLQFLTTEYLNPSNIVSGKTARVVSIDRIDSTSTSTIREDTVKLNELVLVFSEWQRTPPVHATGPWSTYYSNKLFWEKLAPFIRLYKTGMLNIYQWDMLIKSIVVDQIDTSSSGGDYNNVVIASGYRVTKPLDQRHFVQIGRILAICEKLNISPEVLAMWWNSPDISHYTNYGASSTGLLSSVYEAVFNRPFMSNSVGNVLADPMNFGSATYSANIALLANVCSINGDELQALISYLNIDPAGTAIIQLGEIGRLYIVALLARALNVEIADFIATLALAGISIPKINITRAYGASTATDTLDAYLTNLETITELFSAIQLTGFSVKELLFIASGTSIDDQSAASTDRIQALLQDIRQEVLRSQSLAAIYQHFSKEFGISATEIEIIFTATRTGATGIAEHFLDATFYTSTYALSMDNVVFIDGYTGTYTSENKFPLSTSSAPIPADVVGNPKLTTGIKLAHFYNLYRYLHKVALIYQRLGLREKEFTYLFDLSLVTDNYLGFNFLTLPVYVESTVIKSIKNVALSGTDLKNGLYALLRVCRMTDLVRMLKLPDTGLGNILNAHRGINLPNATPTNLSATSVADRTTGLRNLIGALKQEGGGTRLEELIGDTAVASGPNTFNGAPCLLSTAFSFNAGDMAPVSYKNISLLITAVNALSKSIALGMQPTAVKELLTEDVNRAKVNGLILGVKSLYSETGWSNISRHITDGIKLKKRDALVAFLGVQPNRLFAELLIDVEMDACMESSRIKQALSSVQLFVDRVIFGLEKNYSSGALLTLPVAFQNQWQAWRKWFRIWEANRKIFLYPEDWMEPELRDDKTSLFEDFEKELYQDALTSESAENSIAVYISKLHEVAHLQPVGHYSQQLADGTVVTHVISRTYGVSPTYYHRKLIGNAWSDWVKIPVKIEGDHIVPYVWNNRLFVFWLTFEDRQAYATASMAHSWDQWLTYRGYYSFSSTSFECEWFYNNPADSDPTVSPKFYVDPPQDMPMYTKLEITVNWVEYMQEEWSEGKKAKDKISLRTNPFLQTMNENSGNTDEKNLWATLQEKRIDVFKSRMFLYPQVLSSSTTTHSPSTSSTTRPTFPDYTFVPGDLYIMVMFPTFRGFTASSGHKEYAEYIKAFHFRTSTNMVDVVDNEMIVKRILPVGKTYFLNQSLFTLWPGSDLVAETFGSTTDNSVFFYDKVVPTSTSSTVTDKGITGIVPIPGSSTIIIKPAKSNFRLVPVSGYSGPATDNPFFFEDSDNIFFVRKQYYTVAEFVVSSGTLDTSGAIGTVGYPGRVSTPPPPLSGTATEGDAAEGIMGGIFGPSYTSTDAVGGGRLSRAPYHPSSSWLSDLSAASGLTPYYTKFYFQAFYHHHTLLFGRMINQYGAKGLYRPDLLPNPTTLPVVQASRPGDDTIAFSSQYTPTATQVSLPYPVNSVDFSYDGAYSVYNWEIFFHIPMLVAQRLSDNLQFFEAQKWYHYIFDPTSSTFLNNEPPSKFGQKYWKFYPFYQIAGLTAIPTLEGLLADISSSSATALAQVTMSADHPFEPYAIGRLRPLAFMKFTLLKYLDNLIAWGDNLFKRDTIESINEATQLYVLASNLLGKRPEKVVKRAISKPYNFDTMATHTPTIDAFGQVAIAIESYIDPGFIQDRNSSTLLPTVAGANMSYFCLPPNDKLLKYWDIVDDRLYKIRHCQNIQGVTERRLLFDSPIDPAMLVRAAAAGISIDTLLDELSGASTPAYRFTFMVQKANEFLADVKGLGNALLSAIEKRDAEQLALLRQSQEVNLLKAVQEFKQRQIDEAKANHEALLQSRTNAVARQRHYEKLVSDAMNNYETKQIETIKASQVLQAFATASAGVGHVLSQLPTMHFQAASSGMSHGGLQWGAAANVLSTIFQGGISELSMQGSILSLMGGYARREQDWKFQAQNAQLEVEQIEKQIVATQIRIEIAEKDYENQRLQIENAQKTNDFMQFKYTNQALYDWMATQIANSYYAAYQMAFKLAKKALLCYKREIPSSKAAKTNLIQSVHWNSRKKGLLAGEMLQLDIRNMEASYIEDNKRVFELTKHISLAQLAPAQLVSLRLNGYCTLDIPEEEYDMDFPGHINRTIKSVSLSIPCVAGPYASIPCTLALSSNTFRREDTSSPLVSVATPPCAQVAMSGAQNDSGVFDFNFRDERYLPFEGAGAISGWSISLFNSSASAALIAHQAFDLQSISDVIMHIRYTAESANDATFTVARRNVAQNYLQHSGTTSARTFGRLFSLRHEFPNEWFACAAAYAAGTTSPVLAVELKLDHFPINAGRFGVTITDIAMINKLKLASASNVVAVAASGEFSTPITVTDATLASTGVTERDVDPTHTHTYNFAISSGTTNFGALDDIFLVVTYKLKNS